MVSIRSSLAIVVVCALILGCGGGPKRYKLTGSVTFNGKPVPAGSILFEPDASKDNKGPAGSAIITDGKYDTGKFGALGGPYIVTISGSEKGGADDQPGKTLFSGYQEKVELPKESGTKDFAVPASAANVTPGATGAPEGEV